MFMTFAYKNSKDQTYYLHSKEVTLRGGRQQRIYWFAKEVKEESALDEVPEGYEVIESQRTGLPILRKKNKE
jgi:hypothetical protein